MELGASEAVKYADSILAAIQRERLPEEAERGMMRYYCFANGLVAGVALVGFTVLAPEPIGVEGDLPVIQTETEDLIRQGKIKRDKKKSVILRGEDNSYYEKMADEKLHCLDDQLPFELPDGWEWCNFSMIGTTNLGLTYRPTDIEPDGVIVLRSCNIVNDPIDLSDLVRVKTTIRKNQYAQKNDILICARNGSRVLVGKCALISNLGEAASFGAFMAIYRTEYFEYIVQHLRSSFFRSVFDDSNSTAINQLTQDMLKRAVVPLPPASEQRKITEMIDATLFELNQMEKRLS